MSDQHLRQLEAAWRASASVEDESAWLRARVQAGELSEGRLKLAATLGHGPSNALSPSSQKVQGLLELLRALRREGAETVARAAVAAARRVLPYWSEVYPEDGRPEQAIQAAEDWIACPCEEHIDLAQFTAERVPRLVGSGGAPLRPGLSARTAFYAALIGAGRADEALPQALETGLSDEEVSAAVERELIPWALGYSDPVRDRVEARQQEAANE